MTRKSEIEMPFVRDYGFLLVEKARAAKLSLAVKKKAGVEFDFETGELTALHAALSLLEQQAIAFGLSKDDVGLGGFSSDELLRE